MLIGDHCFYVSNVLAVPYGQISVGLAYVCFVVIYIHISLVLPLAGLISHTCPPTVLKMIERLLLTR